MSHFAAGVSPALYMTKSSLPTAPYLGDKPNHRASAISLSLSSSVRVLGMVGKTYEYRQRIVYRAKVVKRNTQQQCGPAAYELCKNGRFLTAMGNRFREDVSPNSPNGKDLCPSTLMQYCETSPATTPGTTSEH